MGIVTLILATLLYLITCVSCIIGKDYPHSLMFFSYSLANLGLLWYEIQKISS